jgi:hypothetical protein
VRRLRSAPRAPLAVAGILATPLFFVGLMAFSLWLDKPTVQGVKNGKEVLGDPLKSTVATIYLLSFGVSVLVVLVGLFAMLAPRRIAVVLPSLAAIGVTIVLLLPLDTWETDHTARYPDGVDLIPKKDVSDLILRGEWEDNANRTAHQIGFWTILIAVVAIALHIVIEIQRSRGVRRRPPVPPPPETVTGEPQVVPQTPRSP